MPMGTGTSDAGDRNRLPSVDVLRGIAILLVVLYHINGMILMPGGWGLTRAADGTAVIAAGGALALMKRLVCLPMHMGRIGVNLFFVISGLCIHMRFAREQARHSRARFSLRTFMLRRFFRIYPVYWAALALGVFVAPPLFAALAKGPVLDGFGKPALGDVLSHVAMVHSFSKPWMMSIVRPAWSLATEEQFYLLYPVVFVALGRRMAVTRIVLGLLALALVWRLAFVLANPPPATFYDGPFLVWVFGFSLPRYYEWSLGALLAWAVANGRSLAMFEGRVAAFLGARPRLVAALGLGFIAAGAASLLNVRLKYVIEDPCYSTGWFLIMAATILPAAGARPAYARLVSATGQWVARRLQSLGRRSFSVYLVHEMALVTVVCLMQRWNLPRVTVAAPLACALIWATAWPFYAFVEAPAEWRSKQVGRPARQRPLPTPALLHAPPAVAAEGARPDQPLV